jgi:hypothetical protein
MVGNEDVVTQGVTAACMLTRKSLFLEVGGFDERYEDVYQDCDYCLALAEKGLSCFTVRRFGATHVGSATRGQTTSDTKSVKRDREKYLHKWKQSSFNPPNPMFSLVTCCNNPDLYYGMMESLPERTSEDVELIPVANFDNPLTVTEALNLGAKFAHGRYIVYCHQDILFSQGWFVNMMTALGRIPTNVEVGIIGFEGVDDKGIPHTCNVLHVQRPCRIQTLDELCLITPRRDLKFDERFKFHYYGADICLQALEAGHQNYLVGVPVKHLSGGKENIMNDPEAFKAEAYTFGGKWSDRKVWTTTTNFVAGKPNIFIVPELNE